MNSEQSENDGWVRPAHSAFEAPTIGQVVERKVGDVFLIGMGIHVLQPKAEEAELSKRRKPNRRADRRKHIRFFWCVFFVEESNDE